MQYVTLLPIILVITLALLTKEVYFSLFGGIISGIFIIHGISFDSLYLFLNDYLIGSISAINNIKVIVFSMCIGGIAHLINKNGGINGLVQYIERKKRTKKQIQLYAYFLGLLIFFDDYANTLITGNAMRRLFDRYSISREKLAFIVDATAAPITSIAFITTWIGFELSQIESSIINLNLEVNAYHLFLGSLKFAFYPILMLVFTFLIIKSGKDFGLMKTVENKMNKIGSLALVQDNVEPIKVSAKAWRAVVPVVLLISMTLFLLLKNGFDTSLETNFVFTHIGDCLGKADSFVVLLTSSVLVLSLTLLIGGVESFLHKNALSFKAQVEVCIEGFQTMLSPVLILILAWSFGTVVKELGTGTTISLMLHDEFPLVLCPVFIFLVGAMIAFSTGSSFGTMSILYPIVLPLVWALMVQNDTTDLVWIEVSVASVLGGAVFGDHCSPISDTTIMSSMASGVDHLAHVKTQLPYALFVGGLTCVLLFFVPLFF